MTTCARIACARSPFGRVAAFLRLRALTLLPLGLLLQGDALQGDIIQAEELAVRTKADTHSLDMRHRTELLTLGYGLTVKRGGEASQTPEVHGLSACDETARRVSSEVEDSGDLHIVEGRMPCHHIAEAHEGDVPSSAGGSDGDGLAGELADLHLDITEHVAESLLCGSHNGYE